MSIELVKQVFEFLFFISYGALLVWVYALNKKLDDTYYFLADKIYKLEHPKPDLRTSEDIK